MLNEKGTTRISKFLSLVLRHKPETIDIVLDDNGWTDVNTLIQKSANKGVRFDLPTLQHIVDTNAKKRFAFNDALDKIRANQGHSIEIDLGYTAQEPPEILYHGTATRFIGSILQTGLEKRQRHHVHLSKDTSTAINVGQRHGKPVVLEVLALQMHNDKYEFFLSDNGVWLTEKVPVGHLMLSSEQK